MFVPLGILSKNMIATFTFLSLLDLLQNSTWNFFSKLRDTNFTLDSMPSISKSLKSF